MTDKKKKGTRKSSSDKQKTDLLDELETEIQEIQKSGPDRDELLAKIRELEASKSTFEAILNISASINSTLNQRELLKKIVDAVISATDSDRGFLMLRNAEGEYSFEISRSSDQEELDEGVFEVSRSVVERAARSGEPESFENIKESELLKKKKSVRALDLGSAYSVPLKYEDKLIGIIYVDSKRISERFTKADLPVLKAFGAQAAVAIENARRRDELESSVRELKRRLAGKYEFSNIVGKSKEMRDVIRSIQKIAAFPSSVFIQGETGAGKELVAKAIHYNSPRKENIFYAVNCGGIAPTLLQSYLFGHIKGAFTGADQDREGAFETANHGTLFLDEITEIPVDLQSTLLRVLQEQEVERIGEHKKRKVDVRLIAAANKDLMKEVDAGNFREDLYYRIHVFSIYVPPLKDRPEDIMVLAEHFIDEFSRSRGIVSPRLTRDALDLLLTHDWPGNVRELRNVFEIAVYLEGDKGTLDVKDIKGHLKKRKTGLIAGTGGSLKQQMETVEAEIIRQTLLLHSGNRTRAAKELDISRQVLHAKINKYKLS